MQNKFLKLLFLFLSGFLLINTALAQQSVTIDHKTFHKDNAYWVDSDFNPEAEVIEVEHNSAAYQALVQEHSDINKFLSLGKNIKINFNDQNIIITEDSNYSEANTNAAQQGDNNIYAWAVIVILAVFFLAVILLLVISRVHKRQRH